MTPRALDLFCGAGGVARGLQLAGFHVTGVDIKSQPRYVGDSFIQGDALEVPLEGFDLVWASPPCQRYSIYSRNLGTNRNHPDLIEVVRARLADLACLTVIENVQGAPLLDAQMLCGSMFGLKVRRHRFFEASFWFGLVPPCAHVKPAVPVFGHGTPQWYRRKLGRNISIEEKREAMGIDWMNRDELSEAIPPAYSEFIGRVAMRLR